MPDRLAHRGQGLRARRAAVLAAGLAWCGLRGDARGREDTITLRFDRPMTAMINARRWDETHHQWHRGDPGELYFDAVHRFLLLRFPGSAEAIHAKLVEGYEIQSARLLLHWTANEWRKAKGYNWRTWAVQDKEAPQWRASVWLLKRPWTDDAQIGPTWNAYINGAGWWRSGGAHGSGDRFERALGAAPLNESNPTAEIDVSAAYREGGFGAAPGERIRAVAQHGFLVHRADISHYLHGEHALSTGAARLWVERPELAVTLRRCGEAAAAAELPAAFDVRDHAGQLRAQGGDGMPTTIVPANLPALAARLVEARRGELPDWMWKRVEELKNVRHEVAYGPWFSPLVEAMESGDREQYLEAVDAILSRPPGWFHGHQHIEYVLPLTLYAAVLPEVARYHLRRSFEARWQTPLAPDKVFAHGKITGMGTLNHMANTRPKALLGAEAAGLDWLVQRAQYGLSLLNRQMINNDGFSTEHGDSYYRGITLAPLQAAARFSKDPFMRLKTSLMVESLLFEDISTYHPGLRHRVSRMSRRAGGLYQLLLGQDVPEAVLHTLSREGVLLHMDEPGDSPHVHGMRVFDLHPTPASRVALMAPWGAEWDANSIDRKPIPFRTVAAAHMFGGRHWRMSTVEPVHLTTYMGRNYALASEELPTYSGIPLFGAWRREDRQVEHVEDFGVVLLQGRLNEASVSVMDKTPFGALQHDNKLLWAVKMPERKFVAEGHRNLPDGVEGGLTSFKAQVALIAYGPEDQREVYVNGSRIADYPVAADHGDVITIREGVTFIGLIPLPATDMGRRKEVVIHSEHPFLTLASYVMDRDEPVRGDDDETWAEMQHATAAWAVEFGDEAGYGRFAAFQDHMHKARVVRRPEPDAQVVHLSYESGDDALEMGFRTDWARDRDMWHDQRSPGQVFAYRRVNGAWPWLPAGIYVDNPLGQKGRAELLQKGGASLRTIEGQMAFLRVDPISGTYAGVNPFVEPTPFELKTPEGVEILSQGPLGLGRVAVRPAENKLWVAYVLPPPDGLPGLEQFQQEQPGWFPRGIDVRDVRRLSARALLVKGLAGEPTVILNGEPLCGPFARCGKGGASYIRIPIGD